MGKKIVTMWSGEDLSKSDIMTGTPFTSFCFIVLHITSHIWHSIHIHVYLLVVCSQLDR